MCEAASQCEVDADIEKLRDMAREFTEGFNHGDVDRIMHFYGDTYVDVNLRSPVQSHAQRRKYYAEVMARGFLVRAEPNEIRIEGDLALVRGTIEVRNTRERGDPLPLNCATSKSVGSGTTALGARFGAWTGPCRSGATPSRKTPLQQSK